jgi:hypothetical protein
MEKLLYVPKLYWWKFDFNSIVLNDREVKFKYDGETYWLRTEKDFFELSINIEEDNLVRFNFKCNVSREYRKMSDRWFQSKMSIGDTTRVYWK